jgi:phosphocarrier protein HPr
VFFAPDLNESSVGLSIKPDIRSSDDGSCFLAQTFGFLAKDWIDRVMEKPAKKAETRKFLITNESGLHARPVSEFVRCAMRFKSEITLAVNGKKCSGVSIMDIMTADIRKGAEIFVTAEGVDSGKALDAIEKCLSQLGEKGF